MSIFFKNTPARILAMSAGTLLLGAPAHSAMIQVTVENLAPTGGLSLTPVYLGFHDGRFDAFDIGGVASAGVQIVAEEGGPFGVLAGERRAVDPDSLGGAVTAPGGFAGAPVIEPGEIGTFTISIMDPTDQRFMTYLSMVIGSNDAFIGSEDALELFDLNGNFLGDQEILVTGFDIYDAGTEVNDPTAGPAFISDARNINLRQDENGVIRLHEGLSDFAGFLQPNGETLDLGAIDFVSDRAGFQLARVSITQVPEPGSFALLGAGLLGLTRMRRFRHA